MIKLWFPLPHPLNACLCNDRSVLIPINICKVSTVTSYLEYGLEKPSRGFPAANTYYNPWENCKPSCNHLRFVWRSQTTERLDGHRGTTPIPANLGQPKQLCQGWSLNPRAGAAAIYSANRPGRTAPFCTDSLQQQQKRTSRRNWMKYSSRKCPSAGLVREQARSE